MNINPCVFLLECKRYVTITRIGVMETRFEVTEKDIEEKALEINTKNRVYEYEAFRNLLQYSYHFPFSKEELDYIYQFLKQHCKNPLAKELMNYE